MKRGQKIAWWGAVAVATAASAAAQPTWAVQTVASPDTVATVEAVNADEAARRSLDRLAALGRLYARVDSVAGGVVFVAPGPAARITSVEVVGARALDVASVWETQAGLEVDEARLARDLDGAAARYVANGYLDARLVSRLEVDSAGVRVVVEVTEGERAVLAGVEATGGRQPSRALVTRLVGRRAGEAFVPLDADAVRRELEASGLFERVGEPVLVRDAQGRVVVQVPVRDAPPGAFDLVLGYLPPASGTAGGVVGSGRLELRNPFGGGRRLDVTLDRTPGLVSAFDAQLSDPFVLGLPLRLTGSFSGYGRDSTFSRQRVGVEGATRVALGLDVLVSLAREAVAPGAFGADTLGGVPRIQRSSALFAGVGLAFRALDAPLNPRRGVALSVAVEQGRRRRAADLSRGVEASSPVQRRLDARVRAYAPTLARQTLVLGLDARLVQTDRDARGVEADGEAELVRFGGATTLRGYDEDAFVGAAVGRLLAEYRLLLGPRTFAFGFADAGYVDQPTLPGRAASRDVWPGYGAGVQVQTGLGLATVTYALNPDLPASRGKVHVGLSVGL